MKVLIDLQHPAHLHFFRPLAERLTAEGHRVRWTGRAKDILVELVEAYGMDVEIFGRARQGKKIRMGLELLHRMSRLAWILWRFRPDVVLSIAGTYVSLPARLLGIRSCIFTDTEHATLSHRLSFPFATELYVPRAYNDEIRRPHVRYDGYHELAYLHPRIFEPDLGVLKEVGLQPGQRFTIMRFVNWGAAHDWGQSGLSGEAKASCIEAIGARGPVLVSSEEPLPANLAPRRLELPVHRIHHLMAHASLVFGESATMSSEAAALGVPAVFIDPRRPGTIREQEDDFGLVRAFHPSEWRAALDAADEILRAPKERWSRAREDLLDETIDVTDFLYRIVTHRTASPHLRSTRPTL